MTEPLSSAMVATLTDVMEQASAASMLPRQPHFGEHTALRLSRPTWALVHRVIRERLEAEEKLRAEVTPVVIHPDCVGGCSFAGENRAPCGIGHCLKSWS